MENRLKFITLCNLLGKAFKLLKSPHKLLNSSENDFGKFDALLMQLVEILIRVGFVFFHCSLLGALNIFIVLLNVCLISWSV